MPRPGLTKREATYEDLMKVSDLKVAEILDGELYASPRPAVPHALAASVLGTEIGGPFQQGRGGPGGWWILSGTRMPAPPSTPAIELAPDWVCEILSPSTEAIDRVPKLRIYAREGVGHVWFVNPLTQTLEVLRLHDSAWALVETHDGDVTVRVEPFDAVPMELFRLWGHDAAQP